VAPAGVGSWRNTPERLIEKAEPLLEPGEVVAHVVRAQEGPNKWFGLATAITVAVALGYAIPPVLGMWAAIIGYVLLYRRRVLLATDRALVVMAGGLVRYTPRAVIARYDVETRIGPLKGLWLKTTLEGQRVLWVVPRCVQDVAAADADVDAA
jgi:hypothetical protein